MNSHGLVVRRRERYGIGLLRCREVPVDKAFAEYEIPPMEVASAVARLMRCDSPQEVLFRSIVDGHLLSSPYFQKVINFHRAKFETDRAIMQKIEALLRGNPQWY